MFDIENFWKFTLSQNREKMRDFFETNAEIYWYNTNEKFSLEEYLKVNCEYPGNWKGKIEKFEIVDKKIMTIVFVSSLDEKIKCRVISFIQLNEVNKIIKLEEYWSDISLPPQWRIDMKIGKFIN